MELLDKTFLIDANIWIAYFDLDDSLNKKAEKIINSHLKSNNFLLLSDYIIQEVITVFLYRNRIEQMEKFINFIYGNNDISILGIEKDFAQNILNLARKRKFKPKLSLTDWSLLFLSQTFYLKLLTFDKQLLNANK